MSNQKSRITAAIVVMLFAVVVTAAGFAHRYHTSQAAKSEFAAASPSETPPAKASATSPAKKEVAKIVGTCNTSRGCAALKDACKSLPKHSYKATAADGSLGVCTVPATTAFYLRNSGTGGAAPKPTADVGLAAPVPTSEGTLYCHGTLFCGKLKKICAALGGSYQPGSCNY